MKEIILDFLKLLANCITVLCLGFASFLILINLYHSSEISKSYSMQNFDNSEYNNYIKKLDSIDKKMNSVNYNKSFSLSAKAKPIYDYYSSCKKDLDNSTFNSINNSSSFDVKTIYKSNYEMINVLGKSCLKGYSFNINRLYMNNSNKSFEKLYNSLEKKEDMITDYSNYLIKSSYQNSSYNFTTDIFKLTISDRIMLEYNLTVKDYNLLLDNLDDIADWYVSEFGGAN